MIAKFQITCIIGISSDCDSFFVVLDDILGNVGIIFWEESASIIKDIILINLFDIVLV